MRQGSCTPGFHWGMLRCIKEVLTLLCDKTEMQDGKIELERDGTLTIALKAVVTEDAKVKLHSLVGQDIATRFCAVAKKWNTSTLAKLNELDNSVTVKSKKEASALPDLLVEGKDPSHRRGLLLIR